MLPNLLWKPQMKQQNGGSFSSSTSQSPFSAATVQHGAIQGFSMESEGVMWLQQY